MSNGVNQCAACGDLWDDDEPHVACRSDHGHDPTDEAVALLKSIGLDITYTDEGLRVVARRIMSIGGEDEQNRQYAAQSKNWTAGYEQGVSDERERAAERVAANKPDIRTIHSDYDEGYRDGSNDTYRLDLAAARGGDS